jgi:hypothetical protein
MADLEARVLDAYPDLAQFLRTTLWPNVDGDNLLELLHRVMRHWNPAFVRGLVADVERLSGDESFTRSEIVDLFSRDVAAKYVMLDEHTAHAVLRVLAGYLRYLYDVEQVHGTDVPPPQVAMD